MAKRPALTEDTFLKHLFAPKTNALPTGIRKRKLAFSKGRTKGRVAAFNRMSPANQELLNRAGLREDYLKGNASITDAKKTLRGKAVEKGFAKPLRSKIKAGIARPGRQELEAGALHVIKTLRKAGKIVDQRKIYVGVQVMKPEDQTSLVQWDLGKIRAYASDDNNNVIVNDEIINPLWYHYSGM